MHAHGVDDKREANSIIVACVTKYKYTAKILYNRYLYDSGRFEEYSLSRL